MTIYHMRLIERLWGSSKFTVRGRTRGRAIANGNQLTGDKVFSHHSLLPNHGSPATHSGIDSPATVTLASKPFTRGPNAADIRAALTIPRGNSTHLQVPTRGLFSVSSISIIAANPLRQINNLPALSTARAHATTRLSPRSRHRLGHRRGMARRPAAPAHQHVARAVLVESPRRLAGLGRARL